MINCREVKYNIPLYDNHGVSLGQVMTRGEIFVVLSTQSENCFYDTVVLTSRGCIAFTMYIDAIGLSREIL